MPGRLRQPSPHVVRARREFHEALHQARTHQMELRLNAWTHYTLTAGDRVRWEVYPDSQLVQANPTVWPTTPKLTLGEDWSLIDVVNAAIAAIQERG